ncbi:hypothetical protein BLL37_30765 [Pseudomonas azotoformans]|uniref:Uncharacterized protein n=1 Tax=Pseudomonas azotoformans TaxID=47878 RepID=A0A1V2J3P3_PSEAZ|nr:hypothetical protein BLL37_30765 [Pseudomonas azotoformans]
MGIRFTPSVGLEQSPIGASLLAKNVNDNACILDKRGACAVFASKLAPTGRSGLPILPPASIMNKAHFNAE